MEIFVGIQKEEVSRNQSSPRKAATPKKDTPAGTAQPLHEDNVGPFDKRTVKVKDMKRYLEERGVRTAGLYEKSDLEKKVREVWAQTHGDAS